MFLLRRLWLVAIITVAVCASFAMKAWAALHAPDEVLPPPVVVKHAPPAMARSAPDGSALVARNMFCSTCDPVESSPAIAGETFAPPAVLIATLVGTDSRATVRVTTNEAQGNWGVGEDIPDVGTITRIGYASIDVKDSRGRTAKLSLLATPVATVAATGAATPVAASPYADRVRKIDDKTYDVDRQLVRDLVGGAAANKGGIRATPMIKDGEFTGVRLLGVKGDSAPAAIGLKSGDSLTSIDGEPIKSAQQLIDLYSKLDKLDSVEIQGARAGKPLAVRLNLK